MIGIKSSVFRFDGVEVREREFSIIKAGETSQVEPKAFRVLLFLLHNPQKLITKEELLNAVWGETAVSENSLTRSVALLRRLLGDDTHVPRYIETVATVGYRFICPVEALNDSPADSMTEDSTARTDRLGNRSSGSQRGSATTRSLGVSVRQRWGIIAVAIVLFAASVSMFFYFRLPNPLPHISEYVQITNDGQAKEVAGTDGSRLFLNLFNSGRTAQLSVSDGRMLPIEIEVVNSKNSIYRSQLIKDVSPDGSSLLVGGKDTNTAPEIWVVGAFGHPARFLTKALDAAWSPDGRSVVYATPQGALYRVASEGGEPRLLTTATAQAGRFVDSADLSWSPDGDKIRFTRNGTIWEVPARGGDVREALPGWRASSSKCCGRWTPDGDFFVFVSGEAVNRGNHLRNGDGQLWLLDERRGQVQPAIRNPIQLTSGPTRWADPIPSRDGLKIYARGVTERGELVRYNRQSKQFEPYLGGISAQDLAFSHDGKYLAYSTFPEGILWRANSDGTAQIRLTDPSLYPGSPPSWSPDGKEIVFQATDTAGHSAIYTVPSSGGPSTTLLPEEKNQWEPYWSPDGTKLLFCAEWTISSMGIIGAELRILDLSTHKVTVLPHSENLYSPRWSPDGRYIAALGESDLELRVFGTQSKQWLHLSTGPVGYPSWSRDSRLIYFLGSMREKQGVYRVPVSGGEPELVLDLKDVRQTGIWGSWLGLDPQDNPLLLRDAGTDEIYALTLERK